jgi:hypothetical protein
MKPRYPIYIVSKSRADSRLTSKALEEMNVAYFIVVEPHQEEEYKAVIDPSKVLTLPLSNHGHGPGLARNWCWEHSKLLGAERHWVMDDNIKDFWVWNHNRKIKANTGSIFRAMEDFCDRYTNVYIAGPQYFMFVSRKTKAPPFVTNTRIYSCLLIKNDIEYRWRGRYNEDTDLSLRVLKDGFCTVQFNAFLQFKMPTQTVKGGCSAEFYDKEGTMNKSKLLERMHPDVAKVSWKFNRWHHEVNYSGFKQPLIRKPGLVVPDAPDNYGMILVEKEIKNESEAV